MPVSITANGATQPPRAMASHLARGDNPGQVLPGHRRLGRDQLARIALGDRLGEQPAAHRTGAADVAHQRARVHAADRRHAAVGQPVEPTALGRRRVLAVTDLAHDRRARPRAL